MLSIVVAMAKNNVIGKDNQLLWHIPNDLRRFREITIEHTIIMGRNTFESLPGVLPHRKHIILTRSKDFQFLHDDVTTVHSIGELLTSLDHDEESFVIGGGHIYQALLPLCEKLYITRLHQDFEGDTLFPSLNVQEWDVLEQKDVMYDGQHIPYSFITMKRKPH